MDTERIYALNDTQLRRFAQLSLVLFVSACGSLTGDPGSRTPETMWDDQTVEFEAVQKIKASDKEFESSRIVVVSHHGVVLLAGEVGSEALKLKAAEVLASMNHVARVHNELEISGPISFVARSNDAWLTTKVKTKLVGHGAIDADRINVTTENGVVFLMGTVPHEQARYAVEVTQSVDGVAKIVKVFEYID
jgi:osmotically-inducible protein OsmY